MLTKVWNWIKGKWQRFKKWFLLIILGTGFAFAAPLVIDRPLDILVELQLKTEKENILGLVSYTTDDVAKIKYAYKTNRLISNQIPIHTKASVERQGLNILGEDLLKRTKKSRTFLTDKPNTFVTEIISGEPQYYQDVSGDWWEVDYATTTKDAFFQQLPRGIKISFINRALAASVDVVTKALLDPTFSEGSIDTGDYTDTQISDNSRLNTEDSGGSPTNKWKLELYFDGVNPSAQWDDFSAYNQNNISDIKVTLEAQDTSNTDDYYALLYNFGTTNYDEVGAVMSISNEDTFERSIVANFSNYINTSGEIKVKIANGKALGKGGAPNNDGTLQIDLLTVTVTSDDSTFYPDPDPEVNTVDGLVGHSYSVGSGVDWSTLVADAGDVSGDENNPTDITRVASDSVENKYRILHRTIFLFDTSIIPDANTISAATLSIYGESSVDSFVPAVACDVNIYDSAPASNTTLAAGDFDSLGTTAFSTAIVQASWDTAGYNDFSLNASGLSNISKVGVSKFGARNANYDVADSAPNWDSLEGCFMAGYFAEEAGVSKDPKLVVTHSAGVPSAIDPIRPIIIISD